MGKRHRRIFKTPGRVRVSVSRWLPFRRHTSDEGDPLADKLKDLNWVDTEEPASAERQSEAAGGDGLAQTVFRARPQNPFGEDF